MSLEIKAVEDRAASIAAGHTVMMDVDFVVIHPPGSKDKVEKRWDEWIVQQEEAARNDRIPPDWPGKYRAAYEHWKKTQTMLIDGMSLRDYPGLTPAQKANCEAIGVFSVEQLAKSNEDVIGALGMGGRALVMKARAYLEAAAKEGVSAEKITELKLANESLQAQIEELRKQIATLLQEKKS